MASSGMSLDKILRFAIGCTVVSFVAAVVFQLWRENASVRGSCVSVGFMAGLIAWGVSVWFAVRGKHFALGAVGLVATVLLLFWSSVLYQLVHANG
jgi:hypothetical protein